MRAAEDARLGHLRMLLEHRLDLGGRDVLPARDDRVALAADHRQAALVVEPPEVARAQRVPLPHDGRAVDEDLAVGGDADPEPGQRPARRLEVARLGQGDGRARLGQPVGLGDRASPPRPRGAAARPGRARRRAAPAAAAGRAAAGVEHARQHRRDERGERDVALAQQPGDAVGVERRRLEHDRARRRGAADEHHQPADVRQRHRDEPALVGVGAEHRAGGAHVRGEVAEGQLDRPRRPRRARRCGRPARPRPRRGRRC